jgi:hypothetical protein
VLLGLLQKGWTVGPRRHARNAWNLHAKLLGGVAPGWSYQASNQPHFPTLNPRQPHSTFNQQVRELVNVAICIPSDPNTWACSPGRPLGPQHKSGENLDDNFAEWQTGPWRWKKATVPSLWGSAVSHKLHTSLI